MKTPTPVRRGSPGLAADRNSATHLIQLIWGRWTSAPSCGFPLHKVGFQPMPRAQVTHPEGFSGFGGKARGFPSPGTLQDLDRWNADSFWLDLLSTSSPSSAERFQGRSLA